MSQLYYWDITLFDQREITQPFQTLFDFLRAEVGAKVQVIKVPTQSQMT